MRSASPRGKTISMLVRWLVASCVPLRCCWSRSSQHWASGDPGRAPLSAITRREPDQACVPLSGPKLKARRARRGITHFSRAASQAQTRRPRAGADGRHDRSCRSACRCPARSSFLVLWPGTVEDDVRPSRSDPRCSSKAGLSWRARSCARGGRTTAFFTRPCRRAE
jgi:hypothetical protein